jgi:hypothetical protein
LGTQDMPGKPNKQVFSRRGTSFLTLSSTYEDEKKTRVDEALPVEDQASFPDMGGYGQTGGTGGIGKKAPLRDVLNEQVTSVRQAQGQVHDRLIEVSDLASLQWLRVIEIVGGVVLRGLDRVRSPFDKLYRSWMILWAGEDVFQDEFDALIDKPPPPIDFVALAEKNIIFTDNHKNPLYTMEQLRTPRGYTASSEVIKPLIMEKVYAAFQEVAPKARGLPVPDAGRFAGRPMDDVLYNISEADVALFFDYVLRFPVGYVGKSYRLTESFAGWAVSGTPDD